MKKLLLSGLLLIAAVVSASAEYVKPTDVQFFEQVAPWYFKYQVISEDDKTVSLTRIWYNGYTPVPSSLTIPSVATRNKDNSDENADETITYSVIQWEGSFSIDGSDIDNFQNLVIPSTLKVIDGSVFQSSYSIPSFSSFTVEKGDSPLEIYPCGYDRVSFPLKNIDIDRSIKVADHFLPLQGYEYNEESAYQKDYWASVLPLSDNGDFNIKIGKNVESFDGPVFLKLFPAKVEIENWGKWYNDVNVTDIDGVPYHGVTAHDSAEIWCGGMKVTTVEISDNATEIPAYKNVGLKFTGDLVLPETLKKIGAYAFYGNRELSSVEFPEGLEEIGDHAFDGCEILEFEGFPQSLKKIGHSAFKGCESQTSLALPENIEYLGKEAFENMKALKKAILFSKLDTVPDFLCYNCPALTSLYLPKGAKVIGNYAFYGANKLENIILPQGLEEILSNSFAASYDNTGYACERTTGSLTKIVFPPSLRIIGDQAFSCQAFHNLEFNEGLQKICNSAFSYNDNLTSIIFSSTLKHIGSGAFMRGYHSKSLGKIEIPNSVITIDSRMFGVYYSGYLRASNTIGEIIVGNAITEIPEGALGAPSILTLGTQIKSIKNNSFAFKDSNSNLILRILRLKTKTPPTVSSAFELTDEDIDRITVIVPNGAKNNYMKNARWKIFNIIEESEADIQVHVTGEYPIAEEIRLQSGVMPSQVAKMKVTGTLAENDWRLIRENMVSLMSLDLSAISNTVLPKDALCDMSLLTEIILPANLTEIGNNAFKGCSLMDMTSIPETVTIIGDNAFEGCKLLTINKLPDALTQLGGGAFYGCSSIQTITASENLTKYGFDYKKYLFGGCSSLEFVDLSKTKLKDLGYYTFYSCSALSTVLLPSTLEAIGAGAFMESGLESIEIPENLKTIGSEAFRGAKLRVINIPVGVKEIQSSTFADCPRLLNVNFPAKLEKVGPQIMNNSTKVSGISCAAQKAPAAETGAFATLSAKKCSLTVPTVSFRDYLNAPQWGIFANLLNRMTVEIPEEVVVTVVDEEEYQEIVEEEQLREEAESPEEPEAEDPEDDENSDDPAAVQAKTLKVFKATKKAAKTVLATGAQYSRLFNGATLGTPNTTKGTRVFIQPVEDTEIEAVYLDNKDITDQIIDGSFVLPIKANGALRVVMKRLNDDPTTGIEDLESDNEAPIEYYNLQGVKVTNPTPGVYIKRQGSKTTKVVL